MILPSAPTTRWAGTKRLIFVCDIAAATARCASGLPIARATSAYETNSPKHRDATARHAAT
ncbi:MAG TPA: hypothetical protein VFE16_00840 [Candidatus Cybelea sp.]|nr:hypothetical protein [Candidatus Cybelea sp.]